MLSLVSGRSVAAAVAALLVVLRCTAAHAEPFEGSIGTGRIPNLPAPFVLPDLSHSRFDVHADWFIGGAAPSDRSRSNSVLAIARASVEGIVLSPRRLYVGGSVPFAAALPPDGGLAPGEMSRPAGAQAMLGNVEAHFRAVFPLPSALEIGFTLGAVAPTASEGPSWRANRSTTEAVSSLDPTNYVSFLPGRVGLRPAGDLRILYGPVVIQARHGLDVMIDGEGVESAKLASRLLGHFGYLVRKDLELSIEATQSYFFTDGGVGAAGISEPDKAFAERYRISDERRAAFVAGPGVRAVLGDVDIGAALVTNLNSPLSPAVSNFVGLRVSVVGHIGAAR